MGMMRIVAAARDQALQSFPRRPILLVSPQPTVPRQFQEAVVNIWKRDAARTIGKGPVTKAKRIDDANDRNRKRARRVILLYRSIVTKDRIFPSIPAELKTTVAM